MEHDAITLLHDAVLRGEEMLRQATGFRELAGSTVVSGESGNGSVVVHVNALGPVPAAHFDETRFRVAGASESPKVKPA